MYRPRRATFKRLISFRLVATFAVVVSLITAAFVAFSPQQSLALGACVVSDKQTSGGRVTYKVYYSNNTAGCDWSVPAGVTSLKVALAGGGGGAGLGWAGGGGGGGQVQYNDALAVTPGQTFSVSIGQGGAKQTTTNRAGLNGGQTTFGVVTALGGGGGGGSNSYWYTAGNVSLGMSAVGRSGGSGGGNNVFGNAANSSTVSSVTSNIFSGWTAYANPGGLGVSNGSAGVNATWGAGSGGGGAYEPGLSSTNVNGSVTLGRGGRGILLLGACLGGGGESNYQNTAPAGFTYGSSLSVKQACVSPDGLSTGGTSGALYRQPATQNTGGGGGGYSMAGYEDYYPAANGVVVISYAVPQATITSSAYWNVNPNVTKPTISGTGLNGSSIALTVGSASYTTTVTNGAWSVNLNNAEIKSGTLSLNASNSVSVIQTDPNGDVSSAVTQTLVLDSTAPSAPTGVNLATASNSGDTSDNITNVSWPSFDLFGLEDGATFYVTASRTSPAVSLSCSGIANSGRGSCMLGELAEGTWSISARQVDLAGNTSPVFNGPSVEVITSLSAPLILNSATLIASTSLSLSFTTTAGLSKSCVLDGGTPINCSSPKVFSGLAQGAHTIQVIARDPAGNTASSTYSFTVDSIAPSGPTISTSANLQNSATPSVSFTGEASAVYTCQLDSGSYEPCSSPFVTSTLADGAHTVSVKQQDLAGNTSVASTYSFTVDTTAPAQPSISTSTSVVGTATPSISFTGEAGAIFSCKVDSVSYSTCTSPSVLASLSEGSHTFYVKQTDLAGNVSSASSYTFSVDLTSPIATLTPPTNLRTPSSLTFGLSLTEAVASAPTASNFSVSGSGCVVSSVSGSGTSYSVVVTGCADASNVALTLNAGLADAVGNSVVSVTSSSVLTDGTVPTVSISVPSSPNNSNVQNFTITFSEAATGFDLADLSTTGTATGCIWLLTQTSSTIYTYSATGCSDGTVGMSVDANVLTDVAGNTGPSAVVSSALVTVDHTAPVVSWTMATPTWASVSALTPSWTTGDASGIGVVTRQVATLNSSNACGTWADDAVATSGTSSNVSDRSCYRWTFTTAPTDAAGNATSANLTSSVVMVDRSVAAPTITSGTPVANSNSYTATFTGETGATFRCSLDGAAAQACTSPASLTALADGSHTFAVYQTDPAGNLSTAQELTWSIDTQIQTVVLTAPASPTNSSSLNYSVVFDKNVTGVSASDFSIPGTSCSVSSVTGSGRNYTVTVTGCVHGDVATLRIAANSTTDASGNTGPSAIALASAVTIDTQAPSAPSVSHTGTVTTADTAGINILGEAGATFRCSLDGATAVACTSPSYSLSGLGVGSHTISVTQTDLAGNVSSAGTASWTTYLPTQTLNPTPTITGNLQVGRTLTVSPGVFDAGTAQAISWLRDGSAISGATGTSYVLTASDLNASISVQVTSTRAGYQDAVVFSAGTAQISRGTLTLTPNPSVTGTTTFGQTLSAQTGTWDSGVTLTYQWLRGGVAISGATSQTYTIGLSDIGTRMSVAVTGAKTGYTSATTSVLTDQNVIAATIPQSSIPTISGNYSNGSVLTANAGSWTSGVTLTYQWLRGSTAISGATSSTYTLTSSDIDATISVRVTGSLSGHNDVTLTSDGTSAITGMAQTLTPTPTISGTVVVGETLTATAGTWDSGVALTYQWLRGSSLISGATSANYTLTAADLNAQLTVRVTGTRSGYSTSVRQSSNTVAVGQGTLSLTPTPTISGNAQVGSTLTVTTGSWDAGTSLTIQWLRDGVAISGANSLTYVLIGQDYQSTITVAVAGAKSGYVSVTQTSASFSGIQRANLASTPAPTIVGLPTVGQALSASTAGWDNGVQFAYRWFVDGNVIAGATASSYTPTSSDATKRVTVEVTGTKFGYVTSIQTSAASEEVSVVRDFSSSSVPVISGGARNGETLTVNIGTWDEGTTIAIQWMRSGLPVGGATGTSYVLGNDDVSETITVIVRGTKIGFNPLSRISNEIGPIALGVQSARTPQVVGTLQVGQTVSANPGTWQGTVRLQYQWFANGSPLDGATSRTLEIGPDQLGTSLSVRVVSNRVGYVSSSGQSSAAGPVVAGFQPAVELGISGISEVGETLRLNDVALHPEVDLTIQWLRDAENIPTEKSLTYLVDQADIGHLIGARVVMNRDGYVSRELTLNTSTAVRVNSSVQDMEIKGAAKIGEDLVVIKERCVSQATYTYQWLRDGIAIDGADGPEYTVTAADLGSTITAVATQFVDGDVTEVTVSKAFAIEAPTGPSSTGADAAQFGAVSFWDAISQFFGSVWTFLTAWIIPGPTADPC